MPEQKIAPEDRFYNFLADHALLWLAFGITAMIVGIVASLMLIASANGQTDPGTDYCTFSVCR